VSQHTESKALENEEVSEMMLENRTEALLVRAEPLEWAEELCSRMVEARVVDDALLLDADPTWAEAINSVLVEKGVRVSSVLIAAQLPVITAA
jgi:hypothetical protein